MPSLNAVFKLFDGYSSPIDKINRKSDEATNKILKASGATDKFNNELAETGASARSASSGLTKFLGVTAAIATAVKGMNIADEYMNTSSRLSLINDGLQTQAELQEKIFQSAERAKGSYTGMANAISKMGLLASESFKSNDELIAFTELLQKSFKVGGSSSEEQSSALQQLTQAMGSGKLQGDEFRSIMENAPMIADAIAKFTGKSKGELKQMSTDGLITSEIIKNAMFAASDDINAKFQTMPMTFADIWNRIKNGALEAFGPLIEVISTMINSAAFTTFIDAIIVSLNMLSGAINFIINTIVAYWPFIQSILLATAIYLAATILPGFLAVGAAAIWSASVAAATWIMANLPMLAIIVTIATMIYYLQSLGVTFEDIFGFVGGVVGVFAAGFYNYFVYMWNAVAAFINFFGNVFNNPIASVQALFYDLMVNVLGFIENMAQGIEDLLNKIPGVEVDITGGITGLKDKLAAKSSSLKSKADLVEYVKSKEFMDYSTAATKGSNIGKSAYSNLSSSISKLTDSMTGKTDTTSLGKFNAGSYKPVTVKGTGTNGAVDVSMSDEDLSYLRDVAERDYINKFSSATLAPNISIQFGDVHETADADKVAKRIKKILKEEIAMAAEG